MQMHSSISNASNKANYGDWEFYQEWDPVVDCLIIYSSAYLLEIYLP